MTSPTDLSALLAKTVARAPQARAVCDERVDLDWRGFAALVEGYAGLLAGQGVKAGDRIAVWLPNSVDYLALVFALARLAATAVHVNTRFRSNEVGYLLKRSKAATLITQWGFGPVDFPEILAEISPEDRSHLARIIGRDAAAGAFLGLPVVPLTPQGAAPDAAEAEAACLTFTTSGTTSGPKLVLHTQRSVAVHARDVAAALDMGRAGACALAVVPLCGTFGQTLALAGVAAGARVVTMEQFDAAKAGALIRAHRVTHTVGGDDMLGRIAEAANGEEFDSLVFSGFANFTPNAATHIAAAEALGMTPRGVYGMSEVHALFSLSPDARRTADGGVPVSPLTQISIRDPETGAPVADGEDGELCLKAPSLFDGYLDNDAATRNAFHADGFFRTGDAAALVPPGFVYRMRLGDGLRLGGFLVAPEEIEGFLHKQPGVAGAQVVAAERDGARVAFGFVLAKPGEQPDEAAILTACKAHLARYKIPARIVTLDAFPVTESPNGVKIQRVKLRDMANAILRGEA